MKQKNVRGMVKPGDEVWAFVCQSCKSPIALANAQLDDLPPVVMLQCPKCGESHKYPRTEARRAQAHAKQ